MIVKNVDRVGRVVDTVGVVVDNMFNVTEVVKHRCVRYSRLGGGSWSFNGYVVAPFAARLRSLRLS